VGNRCQYAVWSETMALYAAPRQRRRPEWWLMAISYHHDQ
jgi:hypothetical protein